MALQDASGSNVAQVGNRYFVGKATWGDSAGQGFFQSDQIADDIRVTGYVVAGNFLSIENARGTTQSQDDDLDVYHNTIVSDLDVLTFDVKIFVQKSRAGADDMVNVSVRSNVCHGIDITGTTDPDTGNNIETLDYQVTTTYTDLFVDPVGGVNLTLANLEAKYAPKVSSALDVADHIPIIGAIVEPIGGRTAVVDFSARTVDFPFQEAAFTPVLTDLTDQALSTAVEASDQVTGVSATGAEIWITGNVGATMELRQSDNSTVIIGSVPLGEHHIIYANEWVHINDTSSGSPSTQLDVVLHIGTQIDTFSHTTIAVDHVLTADDLEAQAEVSTPTVFQLHVLFADDLESAAEVSTPTAVSDAANSGWRPFLIRRRRR